jgi:hypothetical protein
MSRRAFPVSVGHGEHMRAADTNILHVARNLRLQNRLGRKSDNERTFLESAMVPCLSSPAAYASEWIYEISLSLSAASMESA